jgi:uncharacterized protein (DUF1800 family)
MGSILASALALSACGGSEEQTANSGLGREGMLGASTQSQASGALPPRHDNPLVEGTSMPSTLADPGAASAGTLSGDVASTGAAEPSTAVAGSAPSAPSATPTPSEQPLVVAVDSGSMPLGVAVSPTADDSLSVVPDKSRRQLPSNRAAAIHFLTQATFGPTEADINRVMTIGYEAWINEQFARAPSSHVAAYDAYDGALRGTGADSAWETGVINAWWRVAVTGEDQLRQRVANAWSQIMVISLNDMNISITKRAPSMWLDMLANKGLGTYRDLLQNVAMHPLMGVYLSSLKNRKADMATGRVPDENFAREIMQLFSIGLQELNRDGTPKMLNGGAMQSYQPADIVGLSRVFTGLSWNCADSSEYCFQFGSPDARGVLDWINPMKGYAQHHSTESKSFLGRTLAAQGSADVAADLAAALDTLALHPNVGPFIGKQLIQRLVTSNPSPEYVTAVANAFENNGAGVRGDLKAVVKAILLHPEARQTSDVSGKLREPLLKATAIMRAFGYSAQSGHFQIGKTDDMVRSIGQTPLSAPSVFNFFRPGYVAPGSLSGKSAMVAPELQIAHESSVAGYVNYVNDLIEFGTGWDAFARRTDVVTNVFNSFTSLFNDAGRLVDTLAAKVFYQPLPAELRTEIINAVNSVNIPAGADAASVEILKMRRVKIAAFLLLISPEFQIQR